MMATWHLVLNGAGCVLGVYGAALLDKAEKQAAAIREAGWSWTEIRVVTVSRDERPSVGQKVSV